MQIRRRDAIYLLSATIVWPRIARATELPRIGFVGNSTASLEANLVEPFREGLRELGYVEGENIHVEYRWAEGNYERLPDLFTELVAEKVDIVVSAGTPAGRAFQKVSTTIPYVMVAVGDPVGTGFVESLGHPGGNFTGLTSIAPELEGKRLELLTEVLPTLSSFAVLWNPGNAYMQATEKRVQEAAQILGLKVLSLGVQNLDELENAFSEILREQPEALNVLADRLFLHNRDRIIGFAMEHRLPGVHVYKELVEAGGLMSYGPNYPDMHRRAAWYVDRILKGAKPADLPVEGPALFELVINLKTAKILDLEISPSLIARATEIIE
jgi:putative ABC transport system substrate-binding protein